MNAWKGEVRVQFRLALPVVVVQLGLMIMGAVDGAFLGRIDATQYAASAIGHSLTFVLLAFGMGVLTVLDPVISQAWGARDMPAITRGVQRGVLLAVLLSIPIAIVLLPAESMLRAIGQQEEVTAVAGPYARILILSVLPFLIFVAFRHVLQAMHVLRPLVVTILLTNALNVFLDWVLIDGHLGAPAMGAVGSAWGTVIARWCMLLVLPILAGPELYRFLLPRVSGLFDWGAMRRMLRVGLPAGVQWFVEVGAFASVTALMGTLGEEELAGHQVAMHLASASFMIPLGISMAASIRVGNEIGRGDASAMRCAARVGIVASVGVMIGVGALFLLAPLPLARIFTDIDGVLAVSVVLIPLAGFFQVFDGTQVVAVGVMRGMGDTRVPMLIHVVGFWVVALPLGWWLASGGGFGARGLWWGLVAGLASVAVAQFLRLGIVLRRGVSRLVIDEPDSSPAPPPPSASTKNV